MFIIEKRTTPDGEFQIVHQIMPHKAKRARQLAELRPGYSGKNPAGGRKCLFRQAPAYKLKSFEPHISDGAILRWLAEAV